MAKVGYIFKANSYDALDADKEWMRQYGCVQVVEEECAHEALRPQWKQLMASLGRGDELVVAKFSNAVRDLRAGRTRRAVPDQGGAPGIHPRQNRHPGRTVSRYNGSPGTGDVRGPARRGSRVTQVVQPYHATATNHQATGNEEGHVEGGTGKNHRGYVQQRLFDRRHLGGERL